MRTCDICGADAPITLVLTGYGGRIGDPGTRESDRCIAHDPTRR